MQAATAVGGVEPSPEGFPTVLMRGSGPAVRTRLDVVRFLLGHSQPGAVTPLDPWTMDHQGHSFPSATPT